MGGTQWVLLVGWVALVWGDIPECGTAVHSDCEMRLDQVFGNAVAKLFDGKWADIRNNPALNSALCDATIWKARSEVCGHCPLNLVVTEPPQFAGKTICLADNTHTPYALDMHMHLSHPMNGKVMDLKTYNNTDFCSRDNWKESGSDSIALTLQGWGVCWREGAESSLLAAAEAGFPIVIERTHLFFSAGWGEPSPPYYHQNRPVAAGVVRESHGLESTLVFSAAPTRDFNSLIEAIKNNVRMRGKVVYSCAMEEMYANRTLSMEEYYSDGCPYSFLQGVDMCDHMAEEANRLCSRCPVELQTANGSMVACLYGPDMIPSRRDFFYEGAFAGSFPFTEKVVYVTSKSFSEAACETSRWPSEFRGRIVAYSMSDSPTQMCDWVEPIKAAQQAGVKGLIFLNPSIPGLSTGITIPVGSVTKHGNEFKTFMKGGVDGTVQGYKVYEREVVFHRGVLHPHSNATAAPSQRTEAPQPEEGDDVLQRAGSVVCVVLIPVLCVAVAVKSARGFFSRSGLPSASGVPLAVSSTALSLTLLAIVATVSFTLAHTSGQRGLQSASEDGNEAVSTTHARNLANVKVLTALLMNDVINGAANTYLQWKEYLHFKAKALAVIMGRWNSSDWTVFYRKQTLNFENIADIDPEYQLQVLMENGFYYDEEHRTNDWKATASSDGMVAEGISTSHNGWLYDFLGPINSPPIPREMWDPFDGVANAPLPEGYRNVLEYTKARATSTAVKEGLFYVSQHSKERTAIIASDAQDTRKTGPLYSILEPVAGGRGVAVASATCSSLSKKLQAAVNSETNKLRIAGNMSLVIFTEDGVIVASNDDLFELSEVYHDTPHFAYRLYTVFDTRTIQVNALAHALLEKNGALDVRHNTNTKDGALASEKVVLEFDQREYYKGPPSTLIRLAFDGNAADTSGNTWDTKVDGCAGCFVENEGRQCMRFDGRTRVRVLPYLTTRVDRVKATAVNPPGGAWRSSYKYFNHTLTIEGINDVVGHLRFTGTSRNRVVTLLPVFRNPFYYNEPYSISVYIRPALLYNGPEARQPRIIGDTRDGDGAFRWYANGELKVRVARYGCNTEPLPIPTNRWTFLVAVVSYREGYCAVYRDGEEVSRGVMAYAAEPIFMQQGLTIGDYYSGMIDELRIHNRTLTRGDVVQLMAMDDSIAVPSRRWTASVDAIRSPGNQRLLIASMVPTEDVVRDVEANNRMTEEWLRAHQKETERELDTNLTESLLITVAVALAAALLFLVCNDLLTRPFAAFARDLYLTSRMDVEGISTSRETSWLREINIMQHAVCVIVTSVREYKSFMPMSLVQGMQAHPESESDCDAQGTLSSTRGVLGSPQSSAAGARVAPLRDTAYLTTLLRKKVSFVMTNIVRWHNTVEAQDDAQVISLHAQYVGACVTAALQNHGVPEPFVGDKVLVAFNGVKSCALHQVSAAQTSLQIQAATELKVSVAVVCGMCRVGTMGSPSMRKFTHTGPVLSWAAALERYCAQRDFTILADREIVAAVSHHFAVRHVGAVVFEKYPETACPSCISEVVRPLTEEDKDWMYQQNDNGTVAWNAVVDGVISGNWDHALANLGAACADPAFASIKDVMQHAARVRRYDPPILHP